MNSSFNLFIKMGITTVIIAGSTMANADNLATSKYQDEMKIVVTSLQKDGYLPPSIKVNIKENNTTGSRYTSTQSNSENFVIANGNDKCEISVTLSKTGDTVYISPDIKVKQLSQPQNDTQKKIKREFVILHEASHCEFEVLNEVFVIKGDSSLQKDVNYYFKYALARVEGSDSPYSMLNENFADAYAATLLIKKYGDTFDVKSVINSIALERQQEGLTHTAKGSIDSHYTHFSLIEALSKENIGKITSSTTSEQLKQIALEMANKGVFTTLATYSEILPEFFTQKTMVNNLIINAKSQSITNSTLTDNGFFNTLAAEVINTAKIKTFLSKNKKTKELSKEYEQKIITTSQNVFDSRYETEFEKIDTIVDKLKVYITKNHKPVQEHKAYTTTTKEQMQTKYNEMLEQHRTRQKNIENLAISKVNVLGKITDIRANTKTPSHRPI